MSDRKSDMVQSSLGRRGRVTRRFGLFVARMPVIDRPSPTRKTVISKSAQQILHAAMLIVATDKSGKST